MNRLDWALLATWAAALTISAAIWAAAITLAAHLI